MYSLSDLFNLEDALCRELLERPYRFPWEALPDIHDYILHLQKSLCPEEYGIDGDVYIHKTASVHPSAVIHGPAIIGPEVEIRPHAFLRKDVLLEAHVTVGSACEIKNVIFLPGAQAAHFNYVGDSILGVKSHLGAGAITSNFKADHQPVTLHLDNRSLATGLRKFGALIGDYTEIGCNAVLNPGTIVGTNSLIYPLTCVRGLVPDHTIVKNLNRGEYVTRQE